MAEPNICTNTEMDPPCDRDIEHIAAQLCNRCYQRRLNGVPMGLPARRRRGSPMEDSLRRAEETGCLLWTAGHNGLGYGQVTVDGKRRQTHVFMWEQHYGPVPAGLDVCHTCDTPACCEITHLWLGTRKENMQDAAAKGRARVTTSLTEDQVRAIRADTRLQREIAEDYGLTQSNISQIKRRKTWKRVKD